MFALSQSSGSNPVSIDVWKMAVSPGAISDAHSFSILFGIPSGPDAFDGFTSLSSFSRPLVVIISCGIDSLMYFVVLGIDVDLSIVNTDLNC